MLGTVTAVLTVGLHLPPRYLKWAEMVKFSYVHFNTANVRDESNVFYVCDCLMYLVK